MRISEAGQKTALRSNLLRKTLRSLCRCKKPKNFAGCIVVENGPKTEIEACVNEFSSELDIRYYHEPEIGLSRALNCGVAQIQEGLIIFTNDDVSFNADFLVSYARASRNSHSGRFYGGAVVPNFEAPPQEALLRWMPLSSRGYGSSEGEASKWRFIGPNWAAFASDIQWIGGFNPLLGLGSVLNSTGEETDLQDRLLAVGCEQMFVMDAEVVHLIPKEKNSLSWILHRSRLNGRALGIRYQKFHQFSFVEYGLRVLCQFLLCLFFPFKSQAIKFLVTIFTYYGALEGVCLKAAAYTSKELKSDY